MIMDNNLNNNSQSQTWTDPITGESYPSGNPHADINSSRVIGASQAVSSTAAYNNPLPPGAVPQVQPAPQADPAPQMQQMPQQMPQLLPLSPVQPVQPVIPSDVTKFCEHCGSVIAKQAVVCPTCGCQVAPLKHEQMPMQVPGQQVQITQVQQPQPIQPVQVVVNYNGDGRPKDKLTALLLCIFLGEWGIHRFYEGRIGTGILWMFTFGLFGLGWLYDVIRIACASNPYYIK